MPEGIRRTSEILFQVVDLATGPSTRISLEWTQGLEEPFLKGWHSVIPSSRSCSLGALHDVQPSRKPSLSPVSVLTEDQRTVVRVSHMLRSREGH